MTNISPLHQLAAAVLVSFCIGGAVAAQVTTAEASKSAVAAKAEGISALTSVIILMYLIAGGC